MKASTIGDVDREPLNCVQICFVTMQQSFYSKP